MERKIKYVKYVKICERAEKMGIRQGDRMTAIMDIENADNQFNLKLDDWLESADSDFAHDFIGIQSTIDRSVLLGAKFNSFVPRFARA